MIKIIAIDQWVSSITLSLLDEATYMQAVSAVADLARDRWVQLAQQKLTSTRRDYISGLQPVVREGNQASITLVGTLPNMVEQGQSAFDMRDTLLGPNVPIVEFSGGRGKKQSEDGNFYRSIPFSHGSPSSSGVAGGPAMGSQYEGHPAVQDVAKMARQVYSQAKGLGKGEALQAGLAPKLRPHHSTDIYAGMIRNEKEYAKTTQSTYSTFRTISTANDVGWMHPGIMAANLGERVAEDVGRMVEATFEAFAKGITG